jgi:type VI protein secretion system component Hcp
MTRTDAKRSHTAALETLSDEKLNAVTGAGTAKAKASGAGSLPTESVSLSYGHIEFVYTQQR